ncbi:DsbE family thiol:disulfide interchange protein [Pleionea litopenaei]|uniref:DsbE family thiol:disulfide interchange protein n=1 Tax=Pleionea litopenaei TaxID=3070815 RepID=A0AA51X7R7_9GAMM|nr:DsbE family thiol:disulfide interchange protein [Pleionea sp. HL-JVS1]WMS88151.1 DsbE family thiol:disulfide interchange protein [Pleionea sp. HL-JVS1]
MQPSPDTTNKRIVTYAIPLLIIVVLLGGLFMSALFDDKPDVPSMRENKPLPSFSAKKLFSDQTIHSNDIRGQYWLLNVWGSWCPTCYLEHPYLMELEKQGVTIVGVNYRDTESDARRFLEQRGNPYQFSFFDPKGHIAIELGITAAPETFLISPDGQVLFHRIGAMDEKVFNSAFKPLMEASQ